MKYNLRVRKKRKEMEKVNRRVKKEILIAKKEKEWLEIIENDDSVSCKFHERESRYSGTQIALTFRFAEAQRLFRDFPIQRIGKCASVGTCAERTLHSKVSKKPSIRSASSTRFTYYFPSKH